MAKNKSSTALFDVIHAAKKPPKSSPSASIPAPRWWGKDKKPVKPVAADPTENVGKQRSWLLAAKQNAAGAAPANVNPPVPPSEAVEPVSVPMELAAPAAVELSADPVMDEPAPAAPKPRFIDRFKKASSVPVPAMESDSTNDADDAPLPVFYSTAGDVKQPTIETKPEPARARMVAVDRKSGDIRFNLSYGGAAAIGFIFIIILAIAFIAGTHAQISSTDSDSTDAPMVASKPAAVPAVNTAFSMAVGPLKHTDATPDLKPDVIDVSRNSVHRPVENPAELPTAQATRLPIKATRDIGMIYMVIQSYPDQDLAQKACDFTNKAGVPCTLVQGLAGWAPHDWYSVVGLKPYKKHDPALEEDEKAVASLGENFSNKIYNQFQPQGYTWRGDSEAAAQ
jgi:hypothetical protein